MLIPGTGIMSVTNIYYEHGYLIEEKGRLTAHAVHNTSKQDSQKQNIRFGTVG